MRTLDERMAEIGRRSEKIFARRRRLRKWVFCCIPLLLLCGCIYLLQPPAEPESAPNGGPVGGMTPTHAENAPEDGATPLPVQIRLEGGGLDRTFRDMDRVTQLLRGWTRTEISMSTQTSGTGSVPDGTEAVSEDAIIDDAPAYTLTVTYADGSSRVYRLTQQQVTELEEVP